jgi:flagellar hook-associated protein 2
MQAGKDAIVRVDGRTVVRTSNTITDAIGGVTLSLNTAEPGTAIDVTIDRDVQGTVDSVQKFADSYNQIRKFYDEQRVADAPLASDTRLRSVISTFQDALRTEVPGNGTYNRLALAGLVLDKNGLLTLNQDTFKTGLAEKPSELEALFGFAGAGQAFVTASDNATQFGSGTITVQIKNNSQTSETLKKRQADVQKRIEFKREQLVTQFTRMEAAMSRLKTQSSSLVSSMQGLQGDK